MFITQIKNHTVKTKKLSDTNLDKINQAKLKSLELGRANAHKEQEDSIPGINPDIHGIHHKRRGKEFQNEQYA